ncbi:MAG: SDR family NAD(P)-dependent oxidoreductase [Woeseiaceae bacterium]|nr:SDR family NAD(P)-dependent oxidoreductase [Woeseiaceae bacterium]
MPNSIRVALLAACLVAVALIAAPAIAADHADRKAVLVTGATSGIGLRITEKLAAEGYLVYAGARKPADMERLDRMENVEAIRLDVTVQEDIDAAVAHIRDAGHGLWGLINNAGVFIGGPVTDVSIEETIWLFDVNVFGVYRVTQAFAPLIIESRGRISTISSISGIGSGRFFSQYSMSKHAVEAFTDSLAQEMERFGVGVSVIEPGNYDSRIVESAWKRMRDKGYIDEDSPYAEDLKAFMEWPADRSIYKEPDEVADAAMHAMFSDEPLRRYMTVPTEDEARWAIGAMIQELVELNEWQAYSFTRDELIGMLDAALAAGSR